MDFEWMRDPIITGTAGLWVGFWLGVIAQIIVISAVRRADALLAELAKS